MFCNFLNSQPISISSTAAARWRRIGRHVTPLTFGIDIAYVRTSMPPNTVYIT
jgi:hypothetical protein